MIWLGLFLIAAFLVFIVWVLVALLKNKALKFPWISFYVKGKESGFQFKEIHVLRQAVIKSELKTPLVIFSSTKQLDSTIKNLMIKMRANLKTEDPALNNIISQLFSFRKRIEFNSPKYRLGIKSSRGLLPNQNIRLVLPGKGSFVSSIIENLNKYLAISYPVGKSLPPGFLWKNQKINVYFWRTEDAAYYFESHVLADFSSKQFPLLHITHSDNLIRSQKRRSIRASTNLSCTIYNLANINNANELVETSSGYKAILVDLSEDGFALLIGGKTKVGLPLKVQFILSEEPIVMCGLVKGLTIDEKKNRSVLHIQATPPSTRTKNIILTYIYKIFEENKSPIR